eukprot:gene13435-13563_t
MSEKEPGSWAEALNNYRITYGSRSLSTASQAEPVQRFVCLQDAADGSLQRSQWHGWGNVSLLKQDLSQDTADIHNPTEQPGTGRRALPAPVGRDGRSGLFGVLQGTEAGGNDAWLGNIQVDPTKGKRSVSAPTDSKRVFSMTQLLAQATQGHPAEDAWLGNIGIDPAKGKGHAADTSSLRGRAGLFDIMQQRALALAPNKGKKTVAPSESLQDHLLAASFKAGPPVDGCWCDLPRVGKRPLAPPSNAAGFVNAAQSIRMEQAQEPLPPSAVMGSGRAHGKGMVQDPYSLYSHPHHVDMYSVMTFKPLNQFEQQRYQHAWNDAQVQPKRRVVPGAGPPCAQQQADCQPGRQMRYVPFGGLAQEKGMTLNTIVLNRNSLSGSGASGASSSGGSHQAGAATASGSSPGRRAGAKTTGVVKGKS